MIYISDADYADHTKYAKYAFDTFVTFVALLSVLILTQLSLFLSPSRRFTVMKMAGSCKRQAC